MPDEHAEVVLWSPGFSVTIKGATTVDHAVEKAEELFGKFVPKTDQTQSTGFASTERGHGFQTPGSSMPYPPQVTS